MYHGTSLNLEKIVCHSRQNQETNDATIFPLELRKRLQNKWPRKAQIRYPSITKATNNSVGGKDTSVPFWLMVKTCRRVDAPNLLFLIHWITLLCFQDTASQCNDVTQVTFTKEQENELLIVICILTWENISVQRLSWPFPNQVAAEHHQGSHKRTGANVGEKLEAGQAGSPQKQPPAAGMLAMSAHGHDGVWEFRHSRHQC